MRGGAVIVVENQNSFLQFLYHLLKDFFLDMYGGLRGGMGGGGGGGGGGDPAWPDLGNNIPGTFKSRFISSSSKEDDKSSKSKR